jgi:hypothetical protein
MGSPLFQLDLPTANEPCDWSAGLRPGSILRPDTNVPDRRPALRFVGSSFSFRTCSRVMNLP